MDSSDPDKPPTIDPAAARRWERVAPRHAPWLHEEVGSRMEQRLQWIKRRPESWADWDPQRGGRRAHEAIASRYPGARLYRAEPILSTLPADESRSRQPWWKPSRWLAPARPIPLLPAAGVDLLWANMILHNSGEPTALIARWHRAVAIDGFLMFSCLGPDSLRELRQLYAERGWPAAGHELTDMHDWGDMLVRAGFAEPVMDMERIVLSYQDPDRLLRELRELGRNFHPARFGRLRGRGWRSALADQLRQGLPRDPLTGRMTVTFEIIYGHAFKPAPRPRVAAQTSLTMDDMRAVLRRGRKSATDV